MRAGNIDSYRRRAQRKALVQPSRQSASPLMPANRVHLDGASALEHAARHIDSAGYGANDEGASARAKISEHFERILVLRPLGMPRIDKNREQWRFATKRRGGCAQIGKNLSIPLV